MRKKASLDAGKIIGEIALLPQQRCERCSSSIGALVLTRDTDPVETAASEHRVSPALRPAHVLRDDAEAITVAIRLAAAFAEAVPGRDRDRRPSWDGLDRFSQSGLWSMTVPKADGGPGVSYATVARVFSIIASADVSIAQIAQDHVSLIDILRFDPNGERKRFLLGQALRGVRFGAAQAQSGGTNNLDMTTRIIRAGDSFTVTGKMSFAAGALDAHLVSVHAIDDDGKHVLAFVARDADGLTMVDEWSGMGQCSSGAMILDEVEVAATHVVPSHPAFEMAFVHGAVAQIIQAAIDAGIAGRAINETIVFRRDHARPWAGSGRGKTSDDPFVLHEIADLKVRLHAAEAVLARAGRIIDAGLVDETSDAAAAASIAVAEANVLTTEVALQVGHKLFELSGTRSVPMTSDLGRPWRDGCVHTLHDPASWKLHAIGDYVVNGMEPQRHSWI